MKKLADSPTRRLQILMSEDELSTILDYTHQHQIYGRSAAIRRLLEIGLKTEIAAGNFKPSGKLIPKTPTEK